MSAALQGEWRSAREKREIARRARQSNTASVLRAPVRISKQANKNNDSMDEK